jgi:DivIVA domain-containing protein
VGTALIYLLVVVAVAAVFFGVAVLVFGRGEELPPLPPDATPTRLPARDIGAGHVRALRFPLVLRGYRMTEVDWVLDRLAAELDRAEGERDALLARIAELEAGAAGGTAAREEPGSARITE